MLNIIGRFFSSNFGNISERKIDIVAEQTNDKAFSLETMEQYFIFELLRKNIRTEQLLRHRWALIQVFFGAK
jgi:hypothetical protein